MSTRSEIAIVNKDGSVDSIYCHSDGSLDYNGEILNEHYQDADKVRELISLGSLSMLGKYLEVCPALAKYGTQAFDHKNRLSFDQLQEDDFFDYTLAYHRDRGESLEIAHYESLEYKQAYGEDMMIGNFYIFKNNKWYYSNGTKKLQLLKTALKKWNEETA